METNLIVFSSICTSEFLVSPSSPANLQILKVGKENLRKKLKQIRNRALYVFCSVLLPASFSFIQTINASLWVIYLLLRQTKEECCKP